MMLDANERAAQLLEVLVGEQSHRLLVALHSADPKSRNAIYQSLPQGIRAVLLSYEAIDAETTMLTEVGQQAVRSVLHDYNAGPSPAAIAAAEHLEARLTE